MTGVLADTHIFAWYRLTPDRLAAAQRRTLQQLESTGEPLFISAITLYELAAVVERGRLPLEVPLESWLVEIEEHPLVRILPLTARIAAEAMHLGSDFPRDPGDRIIVATALVHGLRLATADDRIRRWGKVRFV